jgi:hypothetical protein
MYYIYYVKKAEKLKRNSMQGFVMLGNAKQFKALQDSTRQWRVIVFYYNLASVELSVSVLTGGYAVRKVKNINTCEGMIFYRLCHSSRQTD